TLRQRMDALSAGGQPFSVHEVLHVGVAVSDALGYAHQRTVHGRVKPENVFLCNDGTLKLTDFGIGGLLQATRSMSVGVSMRAASYLAPEQLKGSKDIDNRADQYATAAVVYEMLTGEAPAGRVKPATSKRPDTPRALSKALDRALEPDPADRFPNMEAFGAALTGRSSSRLGGKKAWVAVAVILLLVVAGATLPRWRDPVSSMIRSTFRGPEAQAAAETARAQALASAAAWRNVAHLLPDDQTPEAITRADEALAAGNGHFEGMAYGEAEASFQQAYELYESQVVAATQLIRDEPSRVAQAARDLIERLDTLERELYGRVAELATRLDGCRKSLRRARTDEERQTTETRCRAAEIELELMNRLKSLTQVHVFDPSLRAEIRSGLIQADRELDAGRHRD
ncbi:MAG: protein kinase, partial [Phycisphaerales bacterium]